MSGLKGLVGQRSTKEHTFMKQKIKIRKLSVNEVMSIQTDAREAGEDEDKGFALLCTVIRFGVEDCDDISDEDFMTYPLDELQKLSNEIMKFSGMQAEKMGK